MKYAPYGDLINLLKRSPFKYSHKFATDVVFVFGFRVLKIILGVITTFLIVRALSKSEYGQYQFLLSCIGLLTIFSLPGLGTSVMQATARGHYGNYLKAVPIAFFASLIGSLSLAFIGYFSTASENNDFFLAFIIAGILFPFAYGLLQWQSLNNGEEKFKLNSVINGISLFLSQIIIILIVLKGWVSLSVLVVASLCVPSVVNILLTIKNIGNIPSDSGVEAGGIGYGVKTTAFSSSDFLARHIDKLLLFNLLQPTAVATYAAAEVVAGLFKTLVEDSSTVLGPKFAKYKLYSDHLDKCIKLGAILYGFLILLAALFVIPKIIIVIFGEAYSDSIVFAQLLMGSVAIGNVAVLQFRFIRSRLDVDSYRNIVLKVSGARIVLSICLVPLFGINGAVASAFISRFLQTIFVNKEIKKYL